MSVSDQKKGDAPRKRLWYILFGASAVCGTAGLATVIPSRITACLVGASITVSGTVSIGVIGGADGPTSVYVTAAPWRGYIILATALVIGIVGICILTRNNRK